MDAQAITAELDLEISRLQQVRALLAGSGFTYANSSKTPAKKRTISAEGRARIVAAQKKRWAAQKKSVKKTG